MRYRLWSNRGGSLKFPYIFHNFFFVATAGLRAFKQILLLLLLLLSLLFIHEYG